MVGTGAWRAVGALLATVIMISAANAREWGDVAAPIPGPPTILGSYVAGCITGAVALPPEGPGYQVVRLLRRRYYGHPVLIDYLTQLGRRVARARIGLAPIGDMAQPRGGPLAYGHASHQVGLDVDILLQPDLPLLPHQARELLVPVSVINSASGRVDGHRFSNHDAELIHLATQDPRVARIFVNPGIKLAMCQRRWSDRGFLRLLRPWYGHDDHFHVRLHCPPHSPSCDEQQALPPGDGCGAELLSWIRSRAAVPPAMPKPNLPHVQRAPLPQACREVLEAP
ncbi:MAG: penicillin-insensitive murein endopeptidase [Azospirillaceae bacterium]|nr:penicillin-insensitive murein endopeptidase [Azospirillaceae bacterium]